MLCVILFEYHYENFQSGRIINILSNYKQEGSNIYLYYNRITLLFQCFSVHVHTGIESVNIVVINYVA